MNTSPIKIAISVGELSADEHGAQLLAQLRLDKDIDVRGMGGRHIRAQGADTIVDSELGGGLMGFGKVLKSLGTVRKSLSLMRELLRSWRPDALVVIDYPDFNLRLCATAHELGIPVIYFIPPKVWAWRSGRVTKLAQYCTALACIFPFEREFYKKQGLRTRAHYVGHPFSTTLAGLRLSPPERLACIRKLGLAPDKPIVAFFPGSRAQELQRHATHMQEVLGLLRARLPGIQALIPVPPPLLTSPALDSLRAQSGVKLLDGQALTALQCASAALMKSGTSNLQAAFLETPFAMYYHSSRFETWLVRNFVKIKEYSPVNIIRPGSVLELVAEQATPANAARELLRILEDQDYRAQLVDNLAQVSAALGDCDPHPLFANSKDAYERAAQLVMEAIARKQDYSGKSELTL